MITPMELKTAVSSNVAVDTQVTLWRGEVKRVMVDYNWRKKVVVLGPCSIHDFDEALEYASRVRALQQSIGDQLLLIMRVHVEKPRTNGGWKGFVHDPHLNGTNRMDAGLMSTRELMLRINQLGVPVATEALDPNIYAYYDDLITWTSIGARTTESQIHRELASDIRGPVGFKNTPSGNWLSAVNACDAAGLQHTRLVFGETRPEYRLSQGNSRTAVVLRGGRGGPNYFLDVIERVTDQQRKQDVLQAVMVDCCHGNGDTFAEQAHVAVSVAHMMYKGVHGLFGLMLESNLAEGKQSCPPTHRGVSITDPCMGWDSTVALVHQVCSILRGEEGML